MAVNYESEKQALTKLIDKAQWEKALAKAQALIEKHPKRREAYHLCAEVYIGLGRRKETAELYDKILSLNPADIRANGLLGEYLLKAGRLEGAIEHLAKAVELSPKPLPWALLSLSNAYEKSGDIAKSIASVEKVLKTDPNDPLLAKRLANLQSKLVKPKAQVTQATPKAPQVPAKPQAQGAAATPKAPEAPAKPQAQVTPATPKAPQVPATPQAQGAAATPKAPEAPAKPQAQASESNTPPDEANKPGKPGTAASAPSAQAQATPPTPAKAAQPASPQAIEAPAAPKIDLIKAPEPNTPPEATIQPGKPGTAPSAPDARSEEKPPELLRGYVCFLSDANSWFFAWKQQWYEVRDQAQLIRLLSAFSLRIFDSKRLNNIPSSGGYVVVSGDDAIGYSAGFHQPDGALLSTQRIVIDRDALVCAEWTYGAHKDKWIASMAEMSVEGVKDVEFAFFLPRVDNAAEKRVTIRFNGTVVFDEPVPRGKRFTTPVLRFAADQYANTIGITADYSEENRANDRRDRAIVVAEVKFDGEPYSPLLAN